MPMCAYLIILTTIHITRNVSTKIYKIKLKFGKFHIKLIISQERLDRLALLLMGT